MGSLAGVDKERGSREERGKWEEGEGEGGPAEGVPSSLAICVERIILGGWGFSSCFRRVADVELGVLGVLGACVRPAQEYILCCRVRQNVAFRLTQVSSSKGTVRQPGGARTQQQCICTVEVGLNEQRGFPGFLFLSVKLAFTQVLLMWRSFCKASADATPESSKHRPRTLPCSGCWVGPRAAAPGKAVG